MLEDGGFNTEHFRAIEDFVVGASVLAFGAEDIPEPQLFSGFFFGVGVIQGQCLATVEQNGDDNGAGYRECFGGKPMDVIISTC